MKTVHDVYFIASINLLRTCTQIVVIIKSANQFYSDIYINIPNMDTSLVLVRVVFQSQSIQNS